MVLLEMCMYEDFRRKPDLFGNSNSKIATGTTNPLIIFREKENITGCL